jgi:inorganic pyrophosphatase
VTRLHALLLAALACLFPAVPRRAIVGGAPVSPDVMAIDEETLVGLRHFIRGYPSDYADGSVNAVIEIPAGTTGKFEVDEDDGWIHWRHSREGGRREIDYLPFVVNYGMVPRTLSPDGDPIDIVVLGRGIERGRVARTRVVGVLEMMDDGEIRDDKLIAVPLDPDLENGFSSVHDLDELDARYVSLCEILWTWFSSYWGEGVTNVVGWGDAAKAHRLVEDAKRAFTSAGREASRPAPSAPRAASAPRLRAARPSVARVRSRAPHPVGRPLGSAY